MNINIQQHVYAGLLAEAKRQGTTVPKLARDVLTTAADLFDNGKTLPVLGNKRGNNDEQQKA